MIANTSTNYGFSVAMLDLQEGPMGCCLDFFVAADLGHDVFRSTSLVNEQCSITEPKEKIRSAQ